MEDDEEKEGDQDEGKDIEVIEAPEIENPHKPWKGERGLLVGMQFLFQGEDLLLSKTKVSPAQFVGVQFSFLNELVEVGLLKLKEALDLLRRKQIIHCKTKESSF